MAQHPSLLFVLPDSLYLSLSVASSWHLVVGDSISARYPHHRCPYFFPLDKVEVSFMALGVFCYRWLWQVSVLHVKPETEWSLAFWREVPEVGASSTREASAPACRLAPPQGWAYHAHAHGMALGLLLGSVDVCKWIYGSHVYYIVRETGLRETESPRAGRQNLASRVVSTTQTQGPLFTHAREKAKSALSYSSD